MDLIACHLNSRWSSVSDARPLSNRRIIACSSCRGNGGSSSCFRHDRNFFFPVLHCSYPYKPRRFSICGAKKKKSESEPILKPSIVEEVSMKEDDDDEYEDELFLDEFGDEEFDDDDEYLEDEHLEEETTVGDGSGGGGISLAGTSWDKTALALAEEVLLSFDGDLGIYAFRTLLNGSVQVRVERLTNKSGSPSMEDIESFSTAYSTRLDEAGVTGSVPDNISLEVSSPGVERVVRIPQDLERFQERAMLVKYVTSEEAAQTDGTVTVSEHEGVFRLISFDIGTKCCIWGLADVRVNREKAGKGRPLSKKQREWRLETTFDSLRLVRLYSEI